MKWNNTSGLHTPSHTARAGSFPAARASGGNDTAISTTPTISNRRRIMIALTTLPPERSTAACARRRNNGPYGDGVVRHAWLTGERNFDAPSAAGPNWYGLMPRFTIRPSAA